MTPKWSVGDWVRWVGDSGHHVGRVHFIGHYESGLLYSIDEANGARTQVPERYLVSA